MADLPAWAQGPEWDGWDFRVGLGTTPYFLKIVASNSAEIRDGDCVRLTANYGKSSFFKCASPEHARKVADAWLEGWNG